MKERPILFSAPMVRAILEGRKTQTRRIVKPVGNDDGFVLQPCGKGWWPYRSDDGESCFHTVKRNGKEYLDETPIDCQYGLPGDRLWVRETWAHQPAEYEWSASVSIPYLKAETWYRADFANGESYNATMPWKPSIHMPRDLSRIDLEIIGVRVERLQNISEEDAKAEGAPGYEEGIDQPPPDDGEYEWSFIASFRKLWESINGPGSWDANPWVWVIEFKSLAEQDAEISAIKNDTDIINCHKNIASY